MPSRDRTASARDATRQRVELVLRIAALVALTAAIMLVSGSFNAGRIAAAAPVVFHAQSGSALATPTLESLVKQSLLGGNVGTDASENQLRPLHVLALAVPSDTTRAMASAALVAGVPVSWTDSTAKRVAIAVEVQPLIDPRGGYVLRVAAPGDVEIALRDSLGLIDSVHIGLGGGHINVGRVAGSVRAVAGASQASTVAPGSPTLRRILLYAEPGWEGKFTTAALEERGWNVEVRYSIGKNVTVTQGSPSNPDTARYAAIIAIDSSAISHIAAMRRYAATGGGVVIAGAATTLREFGELLPGRAGTRLPGIPGALETATPMLGLAWRPLAPDSNAVVLERSSRKSTNANATVVARRFGAGRVAAVAYDGVWEWRMAGPEGSVDAHRQWWSSVVSAVAFAPEQTRDGAGLPLHWRADEPGRAAPYADVRARLGDPINMPAVLARPERRLPWELLLVAIAVSSLLVEWASRRLRGAR